LIELKNVSKTFNRGKPNSYRALYGVSTRIDTGRVSLFTGPSGSGKTTLLALMGCMLHPSTGRIFIDDMEVTSLTQRHASEVRRRMFGFVFQEFNLIRGMSALENTMLPAYPTGCSRREITRRATGLLDRLGMRERAGANVEDLSGGEKQRVAMARALVNGPCVVIADEPTAHLDEGTASCFMDLVTGLRDDGATVLIATHDPLVRDSGIADREFTLANGQIAREA
jgi:putative ABC transport system ATP-binding protein